MGAAMYRAVTSLILFLLLSFSAYAGDKSPWVSCLNSDIFIVSDFSDSMSGYESLMTDAFQSIADGVLKENRRTRMGLVTFQFLATVEQKLTHDYSEFVEKIQDLRNRCAGNGTDIVHGLEEAALEYSKSPLSPTAELPDYKKIIILITDGEDSPKDAIVEYANKLKAQGWWIYSVMVYKKSNLTIPSTPTTIGMTQYTTTEEMMLKLVSGSPHSNKEYFSSVALENLPEYFSKFFSCF